MAARWGTFGSPSRDEPPTSQGTPPAITPHISNAIDLSEGDPVVVLVTSPARRARLDLAGGLGQDRIFPLPDLAAVGSSVVVPGLEDMVGTVDDTPTVRLSHAARRAACVSISDVINASRV